jgi:alpha-tubulin suppressor-like RCC1 family protein
LGSDKRWGKSYHCYQECKIIMFGIKILIEKLNEQIDSEILSDLELAQAFGAINSLEKTGVNLVKTASALPDAADNTGRFFYIEDERRYVFSNGAVWDINNIFQLYPNAWAWGFNGSGRLGDSSTTDRSSPIPVVGGFSDWVQVSAGDRHSVALRANGSAWAWGFNNNGRLGDDTITNRSSPVSVIGGFLDWVHISAGGTHSLGLRADGSAWAWGSNSSGRLGDDSTISKSSPVSVVGGFQDWVQVSAGSAHSAALRANGSAWAWGSNSNGRLGDDTLIDKSSPVSVVGGFTDWTQISAGGNFTIAIRAGGSAWAWGFNTGGRLGDNTLTSRLSPVSVVGGFSDWVQVSAGGAHTIALRANGSAWAWGYNTNGYLGDGTTTSRRSPVSVLGGFTDWVQVSAGGALSSAIRANGSAWTWGYNPDGRLGNNTVTAVSSPVPVVGGFLDWVQISSGGIAPGSAGQGAHSTGIRG